MKPRKSPIWHNVHKQINQATSQAGVYQFLDQENKVLYVGKAKNLSNRLKSYLDHNRHNSRISKMLSLAQKINIITTQNEAEALLLECNLIKKLSPRYNILLRDDKSFANILVDTSHRFPSVSKHRGAKIVKGKYFGPFANNQAVYQTIDHLKKSFLLRSCSDNEFKNRKKPCMEYQIKRCSAPCVGLIDAQNYQQLINEVLEFLSGKKSELQANLAIKMQEHSKNLEFEKAATLRDRIKALSFIQAKQNINLKNDENVDFVALVKKGNLACVIISIFRNGNNYGTKPYFISNEEDDQEQEIIDAFLCQLYNSQEMPDIIASSHFTDNFDDWLQSFSKQKVSFIAPKKGEKFKLLNDYLKLAEDELDKKLASKIKDLEMLVQIKQLFALDKIPERIEIYDNSHTSGQFVVGAFVVAGRDGFIKNAYRKFNIQIEQLTKKDDCSFLQQVLKRRFGQKVKKTEENNNENGNLNAIYPDLIIIDGGKPQLNAAYQVLNEVFTKNSTSPTEPRQAIRFIAMSKGENRNAGEEFFHQINQDSFTLEKHSPLMHYLQRLRDEAHRFAIGFGRQKRAKSISKSALDEIPNIGSKRKALLLNHFGSIAGIAEAKIEDLMLVRGISQNVAKKITNHLKN